MSRYERAADRRDANARSRKQARARRARHAQLMADIADVLSAADAALGGLPNGVVRTPTGPTTLKDITGHIARLQGRLTQSRSRVLSVSSFELAAALEAVLDDNGLCTTGARDERPAVLAARRLLDRWNGHGTSDSPSLPPTSPAPRKEIR